MPHLQWSRAAQADLERLQVFIAKYDEAASWRALRQIMTAVKSLTTNTHQGRRYRGMNDVRELMVPYGARGYIVRYQVREDAILIVRVWHGREDR